jgi:Ohr subfamily peroxiredoxin
MAKAIYTARAHVTGDRQNGHGATDDGQLEVDIKAPGTGAGTNPEQLFAVGYAACFEAVLALIGQRENLVADDATIDAKAMLLPIGSGRFKLGVEMDVTLPSIPDADRAMALVRAAHQTCPYSNATRGNIDVALTVNGAPLPD